MVYTACSYNHLVHKSIFCFRYSDTVEGRMTPLDSAIARLVFEARDADGNMSQVPVPEGLKLRELASSCDVPQHHDAFLLSFASDYVLERSGKILIRWTSQRVHDIEVNHERLYPSQERNIYVQDESLINSKDEFAEEKEAICTISLVQMASYVAAVRDKSMDTFGKALEILKTYSVTDFVEETKKTYPDAYNLKDRVYEILLSPKRFTVSDVVWAVYCRKLKSVLLCPEETAQPGAPDTAPDPEKKWAAMYEKLAILNGEIKLPWLRNSEEKQGDNTC
jgi:hypothetical protein